MGAKNNLHQYRLIIFTCNDKIGDAECHSGFSRGAKDKIKTINEDMLNSKGLTEAEANVAAKAGLIDPEQKYWWLESWQKGEREAERDDREGRSSSEFETAESLLAHLHKQCA